MKPRTRLQFEVVSNSKQLDNIDNRMLLWTKAHCLDHKGFATKTRVLCMDCGESFSTSLVKRKRAVCPHCHTKLKIEQTRNRTDQQRTCVAYAEIFAEFQVIRYYEIQSFYKQGKKAKHSIHEILQEWILPNGKYEVIGLKHTLNWYCDSWNGLFEIRNKNERKYFSSSNRYSIYPYKYHPESVFKPEYKKYGINHNLQGLTFLETIKQIPLCPKFETLLKAKRYELIGFATSNESRIHQYWNSIKICLRYKYKIKDVKIWFDYLDLLRFLGKDLHNPHYVCPKNLNKEHDRLELRKRKIQAKQEAEYKRKKALDDEKSFIELKSKFFGIIFSDKDIEIRVLESVQEHMEEGDTLKHCVFTNEYYMKPDSLILSATVNGIKTETVEISLRQLKVVQSRGLQNKNTEYHDQIISLVDKNMYLIKERLKPKKMKNKTIPHYNNIAV